MSDFAIGITVAVRDVGWADLDAPTNYPLRGKGKTVVYIVTDLEYPATTAERTFAVVLPDGAKALRITAASTEDKVEAAR